MKSNKTGAILIVSLWVLTILSLMAIGVAYRLSLEMRLSQYFLGKLKAEALAKAGIWKSTELLSRDHEDLDTLEECGIQLKLGQKIEELLDKVPLGDGTFSVGYHEGSKNVVGMSDEDRKININKADILVLGRLLKDVGGLRSLDKATEVASYILDWRDTDHTHPTHYGAEDSYYESLPHPYECMDKEFRSVEELLLVKDITPEIFDKIRPYLTIFGDEGSLRVNLNTASKPVIVALAESVGISETSSVTLADRITAGRPFKPEDIPSDLGRLIEETTPGFSPLNFINFFKSNSSYYRIESTGRIEGSGATKTVTVIVKKREGGKPKFVYYHED